MGSSIIQNKRRGEGNHKFLERQLTGHVMSGGRRLNET